MLRISYAPATFAPMYNALAKAFAEQHPGLSIELLPAPSTEELVQRNFRLALVGDLPDVSHDGINAIRFYVERELPAPLDDFLARHPVSNTVIADAGVFHAQRFALPFAVSVPVLFYNLSLLRAQGIEAVPVTWEAILEAARRVHATGGKVQSMFFDYHAGSAMAWQTLVFSRGGTMMSADEQHILFDRSEGQWAAGLLRDLGAAGQIDMSREMARRSFAAGQLAIYSNTSSHLGNFLKQADAFEIGIAPIPTVSERGRLPASGNAMLMLAREPERQALAWEYMRFAAGPVGQTIMARYTGYLALNAEALERDELLGNFLERNPLYRVPYSQLSMLSPWYAFPGPRSAQIAAQIQEVMRLLILRSVQPAAALRRMRAETERLLPRT